jgi:hypothetical protein
MATPRKYPIGRAGFESIISEGFLYVDDMESKVFTLSWSMPTCHSNLEIKKYGGREIIKIGVNVSSENNVRTIDKWVVKYNF